VHRVALALRQPRRADARDRLGERAVVEARGGVASGTLWASP
jgi:hypothetical protein